MKYKPIQSDLQVLEISWKYFGGKPKIVLVFEYLFDSFARKKKLMDHMFVLMVFSISVKVIQLKREANALKNKKKVV